MSESDIEDILDYLVLESITSISEPPKTTNILNHIRLLNDYFDMSISDDLVVVLMRAETIDKHALLLEYEEVLINSSLEVLRMLGIVLYDDVNRRDIYQVLFVLTSLFNNPEARNHLSTIMEEENSSFRFIQYLNEQDITIEGSIEEVGDGTIEYIQDMIKEVPEEE